MMFRLGAILTVAAAAAPWSSEEAPEQGFGERELLRGAAEKRMLREAEFAAISGDFRKQKLRAYINDNGSKIKVQVTQTNPGEAKWEVTILKLPGYSPVECPDGLSWHVHELPLRDSNKGKGHGTKWTSGTTLNSAAECNLTRGHWDPFFACGPKSEHRDDSSASAHLPVGKSASLICQRLDDAGLQSSRPAYGDHVPNPSGTTAAYGSKCPCGTCDNGFNPDKSGRCEYRKLWKDGGSCPDRCPCERRAQVQCEMGDLSGKMGLVRTSEINSPQTFYDTANVQPLSEIKGRSIVFHCGSARVACANFY